MGTLRAPGVMMVTLALAACQDASRFSTGTDHYEGVVVAGSFVRAGIDEGTRMCMTFDANHIQDAPGTLTTSDGRFKNSPLRPMPQIWHDPLSTLSFGEGRSQNMMYVAAPDSAVDPQGDVTVVVSLMESGSVEVRLMRGAPAPPGGTSPPPLFAVFPLDMTPGECPF